MTPPTDYTNYRIGPMILMSSKQTLRSYATPKTSTTRLGRQQNRRARSRPARKRIRYGDSILAKDSGIAIYIQDALERRSSSNQPLDFTPSGQTMYRWPSSNALYIYAATTIRRSSKPITSLKGKSFPTKRPRLLYRPSTMELDTPYLYRTTIRQTTGRYTYSRGKPGLRTIGIQGSVITARWRIAYSIYTIKPRSIGFEQRKREWGSSSRLMVKGRYGFLEGGSGEAPTQYRNRKARNSSSSIATTRRRRKGTPFTTTTNRQETTLGPTIGPSKINTPIAIVSLLVQEELDEIEGLR